MKIVDMHCDTVSLLLEQERAGKVVSLKENAGHLDLQRMKQSGYLLQNFALYVNQKHCQDPWEEVCAQYELYRRELAANTESVAPVLRYEDIALNEAQGKLSAMLTVEEGAVCKGEIAKLHKLYDMGVRMLTLTWNFPNELGYPHCWDADCGLTERGREFVLEMQRIGMIVDVSHLSDAGFCDVLEVTRKPFVASHSNARSICGHSRNLTDYMIRKLAERGGCMGLNFYVPFLEEARPMETAGVVPESILGGLEAMVRHAKHIVNVGGCDVLGLGSDFDGIDTNEALPGAQSMGLLWEALHRAGFSPTQLDKIFGENALRVYRDCLM